jgi:hypothetical protein
MFLETHKLGQHKHVLLNSPRDRFRLSGEYVEDLVKISGISILWIDDASGGINGIQKLQ